MKKFLKVSLIILLCLVLIFCGLLYWQRDHIGALIKGLKYSDTELTNMIENSHTELKSAIESFSGGTLREYTEEEKRQIEAGEVSRDEMMAKVMNEAVEQKLAQSKQEAEKAQAENKPVPKTADTVINEHVSKLYTLKSSYMAQIDNMLAQAASEYYAKAEGGLYGKETKAELIPKYISAFSALEGKCDAEVEAILSSLSKELKAMKHSLDIVKTIRSAYANEKSIKIAQIINQYG